MNDIIHEAVSVWSNVTPLIFHQVKSQDADIKLSFWELGKKLTREGGFGVLCKDQIVSIYKQKSSPPSLASEKKIRQNPKGNK